MKPNILVNQKSCVKNRKFAFTLAEVLITLGIIGVVAAMTLPVLIQKHRNLVVETKLKKFYSLFNQAVKLSEAQNGELKDWYPPNDTYISTNEMYDWYISYIHPYLKSTKIEKSSSVINVYLADGSMFKFSYPRRDVVFYTQPNKCDIKGVCSFAFILYPSGFQAYNPPNSKDQTFLLNKCKDSTSLSYCSSYIQISGWKITKDYPYKVK